MSADQVSHHRQFSKISIKKRLENATFLSTVNELPSVHSFRSDEELLTELVAVRIAENDEGERGSTPGIMHDFLKKKINHQFITFMLLFASCASE